MNKRRKMVGQSREKWLHRVSLSGRRREKLSSRIVFGEVDSGGKPLSSPIDCCDVECRGKLLSGRIDCRKVECEGNR